jgi:hypothetical protein
MIDKEPTPINGDNPILFASTINEALSRYEKESYERRVKKAVEDGKPTDNIRGIEVKYVEKTKKPLTSPQIIDLVEYKNRQREVLLVQPRLQMVANGGLVDQSSSRVYQRGRAIASANGGESTLLNYIKKHEEELSKEKEEEETRKRNEEAAREGKERFNQLMREIKEEQIVKDLKAAGVSDTEIEATIAELKGLPPIGGGAVAAGHVVAGGLALVGLLALLRRRAFWVAVGLTALLAAAYVYDRTSGGAISSHFPWLERKPAITAPAMPGPITQRLQNLPVTLVNATYTDFDEDMANKYFGNGNYSDSYGLAQGLMAKHLNNVNVPAKRTLTGFGNIPNRANFQPNPERSQNVIQVNRFWGTWNQDPIRYGAVANEISEKIQDENSKYFVSETVFAHASLPDGTPCSHADLAERRAGCSLHDIKIPDAASVNRIAEAVVGRM